jgi:cytochrome c biogenesis protein CcdA/thiol-disulfide isomerase/thioredoxin
VALLLGVAFIAGVVTAISPCVLPVLPIVLAGGAAGGRGRPYAIVAGLVTSFTAFTLAASTLLMALGLPDDLLRNIAIAVVLVVGISLLLPPLGRLVERPFQALGRRQPGDAGRGFLLGLSLGLLFTPCAGPIIAAVAALAATSRFSLESVLVTLAYAVGAGVVFLLYSLLAQNGINLRPLRARAPRVRQALGAVIAGAAVLMVFGLDLKLATHVPGYTRTLQRLERTPSAQRELDKLLVSERQTLPESQLRDFGLAPGFQGVDRWLNSEPLSLPALRGKVVLIDFWTYSCINCLRTLPYLESWYRTYGRQGLVIVGVHTPEFAFEHVAANVEREVRSLGVRYPVALDNDFRTWEAWGNRYWPAEYYIDRRGHVRYAHFGEGDYARSESVIRTLLAEKALPKPVSGSIRDQTPTEALTPETYLGSERLDRFVGSPIVKGREASYAIPKVVPHDSLAYGGRWTVEKERIVAGANARLRLTFRAHKLFLVLGTEGRRETVRVRVDGRRVRTVDVTEDRLYTLAELPGELAEHVLDLTFSPGTEAYAFTFG